MSVFTRNRAVTLLALAIATSFTITTYAASGRSVVRHETGISGKYIVALVDRNPHAIPGIARSIAASYGGTILDVYESVVGGFLMAIPDDKADRLLTDPRVRFVEQDATLELNTGGLSTRRSDTFNGMDLWYLDRIDHRYVSEMDNYYDYCDTGAGVYAYVLDMGVWAAHPELSGKVPLSLNFTNPNDPNPANPCSATNQANAWHGTAVGSLIAGRNTGVASDTRVVSLQIATCGGRIDIRDYIGALNWILRKPDQDQIYNFRNLPDNPYVGQPAVINFSGFKSPQERFYSPDPYGTPPAYFSPSIELATYEVVNVGGIPFVTSADNLVTNACNYAPNNIALGGAGAVGIDAFGNAVNVPPSVLSVGGTMLVGSQDKRWQDYAANTTTPLLNQDNGSNSGPCVSVWAPAKNISAARHSAYAPANNGETYGTSSGTSFASPIVAGVVARYTQQHLRVYGVKPTPSQVYNAIRSKATTGIVGGTGTVAHYKCNGTTYPIRGTTNPADCGTSGYVLHPATDNTSAGMLYYSDSAYGGSCRFRPVGP